MDPNGLYSFDQNSLPHHVVTDFSVPDEVPNGLDPLFGLPGYQPFNMSTLPPIPDGNPGSNPAVQELPDGPLDPLFGLPGYQSTNSRTLQQPANGALALNGGGLDSRQFESFNQSSESLNGPLIGLNDYQPFNQTAFTGASITNQFESEPFNDSAMAFGAPCSFSQMTLPHSPATEMFAPNASFGTPGFYSVDQTAFDGTLFATGSVIDATLQPSESGITALGTSPASSGMLSHAPPLSHPARPSKFSCDWPGCNSAEVFSDHITRSQHVSTIHVRKVLRDGSGGTCKWPGCTKTKLDTNKKLELHVTNIHIEPLSCTVRPCKRTEPFERKGDLDRHISSVHKRGRTWKCPQKNCDRHIKGFPRKDKLDSHVRLRGHGAFPCRYVHCIRPFLTQAELSSHYDDHGSLECGISSCKDKISAFSLQTLSLHLYCAHRTSLLNGFGLEAYSLDLITESVKQFVERSQGATLRVFKGDLEGLNIDFGIASHADEITESTAIRGVDSNGSNVSHI